MRKITALCAALALLSGLWTGTARAAFDDVPPGAYYTVPVEWAVEKHVTAGVTETEFRPMNPCTRAHAVTFLWRAAGQPEPSGGTGPDGAASFEDVPAGAYYEKAVRWAAENGITAGTTASTFSPARNCTRAQIVTFLWRRAGSPEPAGRRSISGWDVPDGAYYEKAVRWALEENITGGTAPFTFDPGGTCTRGQIVTFLYRYLVPSSEQPHAAGIAPGPGLIPQPGAVPADETEPETVETTTGTGMGTVTETEAVPETETVTAEGTPSTAETVPAVGTPAVTEPVPETEPAPNPVNVYDPAAESDKLRSALLSVIDGVQDGGGYYTSHTPSKSFPRTAWDGLYEAFTLTDGRPVIDLAKARPSFCSEAAYLALMRALLDWDTAGTIPPAAWANLKPWCLDGLRWGYQYDGMGCWGRANANGPGLAVLLAQLGAGESRYIGGKVDFPSAEAFCKAYDGAVPGDFLKIFWNIYIGADDSQKGKAESGHLVVFLGREVSYLPDGTRDDWISYWSSNGSGASVSGGYGKSKCRASQIRRAVLTHVTDPAAFSSAVQIAPDNTDRWLSALDGKHLGTVKELKAAISGAEVSF